jgi:hypothetical protein
VLCLADCSPSCCKIKKKKKAICLHEKGLRPSETTIEREKWQKTMKNGDLMGAKYINGS